MAEVSPAPSRVYTGCGGRVHWSYCGKITLCGQMVNREKYVRVPTQVKDCQVCLGLLKKNEDIRLRARMA